MSIQQQKFKEIADKIREKLGTTALIKPLDFASKIDEVYTAGQNAGGGGGGSYDQGFADGKKAEYDAFWDSYQENGNRTAYNYGFAGSGWTDTTFKPKYDIIPSGAVSYLLSGASITDLEKCLEEQGVVMDWKNVTSVTHPFGGSSITHIGELDLRGMNTLQYLMSQICQVVNIDNVILRDDGSQDIPNNTFQGARQLEEIRFSGKFGVSVSFQWSTKLSHDSLMSIINALADKTGDTSGTEWVCSLGTTNLEKLTNEEIAIATGKGWGLA